MKPNFFIKVRVNALKISFSIKEYCDVYSVNLSDEKIVLQLEFCVKESCDVGSLSK